MHAARAVKAILGLAALGGAGFYTLTIPAEIPQSALAIRKADAANGETMFNVGGCTSCHATPKQADKLRLGGGLELKTQFGTFVVPNISADKKDGIGGWSEQQFATAMIKGVGRNGEHLYPAFPYTSYQRMTLADVRDLYAFMQTLPAVATPSQPHKLGFPFNIRRGLGLWKLLFLDGRSFVPGPGQDAVLARGAYLVEGPGHCAECHSTRNPIGGITAAGRFAGGPNPEGKGYIPNITPHPDGLATWSEKDVDYLLATGFTPNGGSVDDSMGEVTQNTAKLSAADRMAMARYIKSLPPRAGAKPPAKP